MQAGKIGVGNLKATAQLLKRGGGGIRFSSAALGRQRVGQSLATTTRIVYSYIPEREDLRTTAGVRPAKSTH